MDETLAPPGDIAQNHTPDEQTALNNFLDVHRLEFHRRVWGLTASQLATTVAASSLTLAGLLKHMALVEHSWFEHRFAGADEREPWASADWDNDPDWEFRTAVDDQPDDLIRDFVEACERSRAVVEAASSPDQLSKRLDQNDRPWNLRWIMIHMIEEYARHLGHADLIREVIDGTTG
jgi:uncharacterized damage-inducible protein DinB|tara:strand:+ start:275 stop:805 length:531 start_codon:yes stop_codon:yes gene_type:complete